MKPAQAADNMRSLALSATGILARVHGCALVSSARDKEEHPSWMEEHGNGTQVAES